MVELPISPAPEKKALPGDSALNALASVRGVAGGLPGKAD